MKRLLPLAAIFAALTLASPASAAGRYHGSFASATWITHPSPGVTVRTVVVAQTSGLYGGALLYVEQETITPTTDTDVEGIARSFTYTHTPTTAAASGTVPGVGAVSVVWRATGAAAHWHTSGAAGSFTPADAAGTVGGVTVTATDEYPGTGLGRVVTR